MSKSIKYNLIFTVLFFGLFVTYFAIYSYLLQLNISYLHLTFIAMFSISYIVLLNFINKQWWYFICYIGITILLLFSLVNFAYFQIFKNFIVFGPNQISQVNSGLLYIFQDFYHLVPNTLYTSGALLLVAVIILASIYFEIKIKRKIGDLLFQNTKFKIFIKIPSRPIKKILLALLFFVIINFSIFNFVSYLQNNPKQNWWKNAQKLNEIGFLGDFYEQLFSPWITTQAKNENSSTMATTEKSNDKKIAEKKYILPEDILEQTKYIYQTILPDLAKTTNKIIGLPQIAPDTNVLIIQLESVSDWAINNDPSPMPFLKSLIKDNISVDNFHANSCQTVNAEFTSLCGYWPDSEGTIDSTHLQNDFNCLPQTLKDKNYESYYFHSDLPNFYSRDVLLPKWSFDYTYLTPYFRQKEDDEFVFLHSLDILAESEKPFLAYVLSFTTHSPHNDELIDYNLEKNNLKITPWRDKLNPEYVELLESEKHRYENKKLIENYYGFLKTTDDALKATFTKLSELDMLNDTLIVIHNDHRFYSFFSDDFKGWQQYNLMPFVIITPEKDKMLIQDTASHLDIAPTILHLLNQDTTKIPQHFTGHSLFADDFPNQVLNKCLDNVYYANKDLLIEGSNKSNIYHMSKEPQNMTSENKENWLSWVKTLAQTSDQVLDQNKLQP